MFGFLSVLIYKILYSNAGDWQNLYRLSGVKINLWFFLPYFAAEKSTCFMNPITANGYSIHFNESGYSFVNQFINKKKYSKIFVLADQNTNAFCLPGFLSRLAADIPIEIIELDAEGNPSEHLKDIATCTRIWTLLTEMGGDRKSLLINLGGGVITDLGGFVASTFKRGIDFIHVPTTLLAMIDAAIGGKNGIDLGPLKNQVGTITVPGLLLIDTQFLHTLPQREMRSGLAEMLKHGLIADAAYWQQLQDLGALVWDDLDKLIYRSVEIKNDIVRQDPSENGIRKALNFGHTLGHAIESHFLETGKPLLHGEAIAAGMVLESYLSKEKLLLSETAYLEVKNTVNALFERITFDENDISDILGLLIHDKKNEYGKVQFALLDGIGKTALGQFVENSSILAAFADYKL